MRFSETTLVDMLSGTDPQRTILLANIDFPSGMIYCHTGVGELYYNGNKYLGLGQMAEVAELQEDDSASANQVNLTLYIADNDVFSSVMNEDPTNRGVEIYLGALDENRQLTAAELIYAGDIVDFTLSKSSPYTATATISDWFEVWANPVNNAKYSDASQQILFPGDKFFDQVEALAKGINDMISGKVIGSGTSSGGSYTKNQL